MTYFPHKNSQWILLIFVAVCSSQLFVTIAADPKPIEMLQISMSQSVPESTTERCKCKPDEDGNAKDSEKTLAFRSNSNINEDTPVEIVENDGIQLRVPVLRATVEGAISPPQTRPQTSFKSYKTLRLFADTPDDLESEFLELGTIMDSFKGPRRRKRQADTMHGFRPVYYVYPISYDINSIHEQHPEKIKKVEINSKVNLDNSQPQLQRQHQSSISAPVKFIPQKVEKTENGDIPANEIKQESQNKSPNISKRQEDFTHPFQKIEERVYYSQPEQSVEQLQKSRNDDLLQQAMQQAWDQYGPKSKQYIEPDSPPEHYIQALNYNDNQGPDNNFYLNNSNNQNPNYTNQYSNNFQAMESEWDTHITPVPVPVRNRIILQPGIFNRLLSSYVDFEVNNHELADFLRRVTFGVLIGILIVGWIGLGAYLGFIPFTWLLFSGKPNLGSEGKLFYKRNDLLSEITDRIFLALDSDWLKKLEERVQKDSNRKWIKTHVHCCILPDNKTKGMADCQVIRKARKLSTFKCLSDLIYNFQFGPTSSTEENKEDFTEQEI